MAGTLAAILYFGLSPKQYQVHNSVRWLEDRPGLEFDGSGIAYLKEVPLLSGDTFSIQIAFAPASPPADGFSLILMAHDGHDDTQLIIGQWRSTIIIMNGDDYDHSRRLPRVSFDTATLPARDIFLSISSGLRGTRVQVNGELVTARDDLILRLPGEGKDPAGLILGNSVYARHPWSGSLYGLAIYGEEISTANTAQHYLDWTTETGFGITGEEDPKILLTFDNPSAPRDPQLRRESHNLTIPDQVQGLRRQILRIGDGRGGDIGGFVQDILLNLFGFMPFGFALCALMLALTQRRVLLSLLLAI
ncbi:MAG: hypothetical protein E4H09_02690, partial [Spirochaetales bacterium]